jgi:hypothetical protein
MTDIDDLLARLRKPIDADGIYDWIIQKRKETTSDLPRLGFINEMELIDEQRMEAAAAIATLLDHAALAGDGAAGAYNNGYKHAAEKFGAEITTLRTQLAAHREAAVRDMRERAAKEAEDFWGVDSAADRIRALPLSSK